MYQVSGVYLMVCLKSPHVQGHFCLETLFMDTSLNVLSWNSLVSLYLGSLPTGIICMGISGFVTDSLCAVWCHGLTTVPVYFGPLFGKPILSSSVNLL